MLKSEDMAAIIVVSAQRVQQLNSEEYPVPIHQIFFEDGNHTQTFESSTNGHYNGAIFKVCKSSIPLFPSFEFKQFLNRPDFIACVLFVLGAQNSKAVAKSVFHISLSPQRSQRPSY